jgi:hypothetical protein
LLNLLTRFHTPDLQLPRSGTPPPAKDFSPP